MAEQVLVVRSEVVSSGEYALATELRFQVADIRVWLQEVSNVRPAGG